MLSWTFALPPPHPHQKQRTATTCVIFILGSPWTPTDKHQKCFCFTVVFWFYYDHYSTFWSNCRTSPSRLSTESGNILIAMGSAVNFRTTFSSFGFILSDIDIEDNCYSLHYYLCVMQDVKCARFSTSGSSAAQKKTIYKIKQTNKLPKVMNGPFFGSDAHQ